MEVEISHRNRNITGPHAVGRADLILAGIVRIDGQRRLGKPQGRLFSLCKKLFGFVAKMCQASYDSNAKTTLNNPTARHGRDTLHSPHRHSCGGRNPELRGASVRPEPVEACPEGTRRGPPARVIPRLRGNLAPCAGQHTDTTLLPPHRCLRYRLPMEAISHRNQNITGPSCRQARKPERCRHGPHRWSKAARQATGEVVSSPRKNSTRLDSNWWLGRHRTRPPQAPP